MELDFIDFETPTELGYSRLSPEVSSHTEIVQAAQSRKENQDERFRLDVEFLVDNL